MNSSLLSRLADLKQQHLLRFYDELEPRSQEKLGQQIDGVDFMQIARLFGTFGQADAWAELAKRAQPPIALRMHNEVDNFATRDAAVARGEQALAEGQLGMILVAGGQGSRLGFEHPKGLFPLGPVTNRTLFQIHIDKLKAINAYYGCKIPLYVMTSPATHLETEEFLAEHHWFGYPGSCTRIFCQGSMPAVDAESGRVLLAAKDRLCASPDGHGGMLAALNKSNCLRDMTNRELQQVFYCQIDNPLSQICDPATIGYHILAESEMSSQAVPKLEPLQKVGNIVSIDNRVQIIEYSDLPEEVARKTNDDGSLMYWAGNIAVHIFDVAFLDRMTSHADALPFHLAHKKVSFLDNSGKLVQPDEPNAIKFERFIFDLLPLAKHSIVVEVDPAEAFSPLKNAATESTNTALTAQQSMIDQAKRILAEVGVAVADGVAVELNPLLAIDREKLKSVIEGCQSITEATYVQ